MIAGILIAGAQSSLTAQDLNLKLSDLELPVTIPYRELVLGVAESQPEVTFGLFPDNYLRTWQQTGKIPTNYDTPRIGSYSVRVAPAILGSRRLRVLTVDATRTQLLVRRGQEIGLRHRLIREFYVDEQGTLVADHSELRTLLGTHRFHHDFDARGYVRTVAEPDGRLRTLGPVEPGPGIDAYVRMFPPAAGSTSRTPRSVFLADPITGEFQRAELKPFEPFDGRQWGERWKGSQVDWMQGGKRSRIFVSDEGFLLRVDLPDHLFLLRDVKPTRAGSD